MNKNSLPQFVGVIVSVIVVLAVNDYVLVDLCVADGGTFNYDTGECVSVLGEVTQIEPNPFVVAGYFVLALTLAVSISLGIRKVFGIKPNQ